jgi:hypothetical protein
MGGLGLSVDEHVALLKQIGWDGFFTGWNRESLSEFAAAAEKYDMIWQSIHAPFTQVRYMWDDGELGVQVTDELIECVRDCALYHVPVMVIHPFIGFEEHNPTEVGLQNFGRIIEEADRQNHIHHGKDHIVDNVLDLVLGCIPGVGDGSGHIACAAGSKGR